MNLLGNLSVIWNKISIMQKAMVIAALMACGIISVLLTGWAAKADMRPLFISLNIEEAAKITDKLAERGIEYELRGNGTSIYVAQDRVYSARMELAKEGLPETDQGGYKIFESSKISASPLVQQMNHKQALEEELAKSIQMIQGIEYARVLIVTPEQSLFNSTESRAKASVSVKLRPGWKLSSGNIAAITNLTSSAIEGLNTSNVTIVDSNGRLLSNKDEDMYTAGANTYQDYKLHVEEMLASKALQMLETVLGPGKATVKVNADIDMTSVTTQTTEYDKKGVPTKETINSTTKTKSIPAGSDGEEVALKETSTEKEEQNETEMLVGKVITNKVDVPGKVKAISVAVIVDLNKPSVLGMPTSDGAPKDATQTKSSGAASNTDKAVEKIMTVEQVKEIIKNALGRDLLLNEESLTVVDAAFGKEDFFSNPAYQVSSSLNIDKYIEIIRNSSMPLMAFFAFLTILVLGKGSKKKTAATSSTGISKSPVIESQMDQLQLTSSKILQELFEQTSDTEPEIVYRKHIANSLRSNPEEVKQLFASWMQED